MFYIHLIIRWLLGLLAYAEVGEDVLEDVGGCDFAGDLAEVVENLADVVAEEVGRRVAIHSREGGSECRIGLVEG